MSLKVRAIVVAIAIGMSAAAAHAQVRQPAGYFVIQAVGSQNIKDVKLSSSAWNGIVIRETWSHLSPLPGVYDWSFLDQQTARARRLGKNYILAIYTGNNAPLWLRVPLFKAAPYPWDLSMLAAHGQMVAALGRRYANDANLVAVELSGPTRGPSGSLEMHLASGLVNQPGYSPQRMISAWTQCIDQYAAAFPRCGLISDGGVAPAGGDATITQAVFNYLFYVYPNQANVSHCALKANTPETALHHLIVVGMAQLGCRVGFEMIGPSLAGVNGEAGPVSRFGGEFSDALDIADRAGAQWLKVYQGDEVNILD
jgi:hypothetical protein